MKFVNGGRDLIRGDANNVLVGRKVGGTRNTGFKLDQFSFNNYISKNWFNNRVADDGTGLAVKW